MKRITTVARILLGLAFLVFGANYFVPFLPEPAVPAAALAFIMPFAAAKYLTIIKAIEVAAGVALLANRFVPLALTLLAPILIGIVNFHAQLEPSGLPVPVLLIALELVLAYAYRAAFAPMLRARVEPAASQAAPARRPALA
ncbi:MAG TPA: hypothetical protein VGM88_32735 [Kofleriaceae bacterium]|jgi:hypothetical protein